MPKQNVINSEKTTTNLNIIVSIFGIIIAVLVAVGIFSLNSDSTAVNDNQSTNTPSRNFDQTTISSINSLTGEPSQMPTSRNNPFSK